MIDLLELFDTSFIAVAVSFLFSAIFFMLLKYLSRGEGVKSKDSLHKFKEELKESITHSSHNSSKLDALAIEIESLKESQSAITTEQREQLVLSLKQKISEDNAQEFINEIEKKAEEKFKNTNKYIFIEKKFRSTILRLNDELFSLSKRGNLNLAIGITTTVLGLTLLGTFVLSSIVPSEPKLTEQFIYNFIPRISLVILIEIFAYFFLRLYKENLSEIKYFQNEITTIEIKYLALKAALKVDDIETIKEVISNFASTERNFILSKGQSTVDIERAKIEHQSSDSLISKLSDVIAKKSRK